MKLVLKTDFKLFYYSPRRFAFFLLIAHTHYLHEEQSCADGRGTFVCSDYETDKNNLQESIDALGDNTSFCFPFYMTSETSLKAVKDSGFKMSFVGGNVKAKRTNDKFLIPRYPIMSDITLNQFISKIS